MNTKDKEINEKVRASYQAALSKDYEKAIALCREAIELNWEDLSLWAYYRYLAYRLKEQQKRMAEKLLEDAKSQYLSNDFNQALTNCEKALTINSRCSEAWNVRGVVLGKLGRHQEAINSLNEALEIKSTDCKAWYNLGNALCELNRLEDALSAYKLAIVHSGGDYYEAWYNQGTVFFDLGRFPEALDSYNTAIIINPNDHETWNDKGVVLSRMGRFDDALKSYDKAIELNPDAYDTWHNRALTLNIMADNPTQEFN